MKEISFTTLFLITLKIASAQIATFNRAYHFSLDSNNYSASVSIANINGNIMYYGSLGDVSQNKSIPHLGMTDYKGDKLWSKNISLPYTSQPYNTNKIIKISDSNYFVSGTVWDSSIASPNTIRYPYFHFFKPNGDSIKTILLSDTSYWGYSILNTLSNDGYIYTIHYGETKATHTTISNGQTYIVPDSLYTIICKFDTNGINIWKKKLFSKYFNLDGYYNIYYDIVPTKENGILLSSYTKANVPYMQINSFVKYDFNGNVIWQKSYKPNSFSAPWDASIAIDTTSNNYYFCTNVATVPNSANLIADNSLLYFGKMNSFGDTLWTKMFADTGGAFGYKWTQTRQIKYFKSKIYISAYVYYIYPWIDQPSIHPTLLIFDSIGNILSYREYYNLKKYDVPNYLYDLHITDTSIIADGYANNWAWLLKLDSFGCLMPGCQSIDSIWNITLAVNENNNKSYDLIVYPNPTNGIVKIKTDEIEFDLMVTDLNGRILVNQKASNKTNIDLSNFSSGIYFVKVFKDGYVKAFKIKKE